MRERSNTCCFTGHRDISGVTYDELMQGLRPMCDLLYQKGYRYFVCGGAIGFDTFAEMYIVTMKKLGYDVHLVLMLPCRDQTARWSAGDRRTYEYLMSYADEVIVLSERYYNGCMQARNRAMVDASSVCVCYLNEQRHSGTRSTVEYAHAEGLTVVNVAPSRGL